ncbi:MAG: ATP-binding protein, partial [Lachnospiraceae bacterium]|nr:ATP-binding protein [Lachnospiraceae bacterium]
ALFFDIGTNGELVLGNNEWLLAGAGAAGPALEGYISRFGVRAQAGAIDTVTIQENVLHYTTIENQKPVGICGSGIIDLLAQMRLHGWMNIAGELNPDASPQIIYLPEEEQYVVVYASAEESALGTPLYFSQTDIRQYLDTKAAAFTMIDCLLETAGCSETDLTHCYLSGAFTAHSNLESAITIGVFPDLPREKYSCIPNASLDGARTLLLDRSRFSDIRYLIENMYCVQFASIPDFIIRMQAAKFIPHTDMERYPTIAPKLPSC